MSDSTSCYWTSRSASLAEFFAESPLRDSELEIDRIDVAPRDVAL
jgi:hypothetical protein